VPQQHVGYPQHPMHMIPQQHPHYPAAMNPYAPPPHPQMHPMHQQHQLHQQQQPHIKSEPVDRYVLGGTGMASYAMPTLPGPQINAMQQSQQHPGGQQSVLSFPPARPSSAAPPRPYNGASAPATAAAVTSGPQTQQRIPQVDGPSSSESESASPPPSQTYASRSSHPSLPQPMQASTSSQLEDSEAINSDLDDSDTGDEDEAEEGGVGETDIVFCTYDKVARVKNKWKCILKDGMIHVNGKDYLFAKCTGEFEW